MSLRRAPRTRAPFTCRRPNRLTLNRLEDRAVPSAVAASVLPDDGGPCPCASCCGHDHGTAAVMDLPAQHYVFDPDGYLSGPSDAPGLDVALGFLGRTADRLGLLPGDVADPAVTSAYSDGPMTHVYLNQRFNGLEVLNANLGVHVAADGRVINVGGGFVPRLSLFEDDPAYDPAPKIRPEDATFALAGFAGLPVPYGPLEVAEADGTARDSVVVNKELSVDPIPANLAYVYTEEWGTRLAWELVARLPDGERWYHAGIDAETAEVLFLSNWVDDAAVYNALPLSTEHPNDGGRVVLVNPADPNASPFGWHDTNGAAGAEFTDTRGNNVFAQDDLDANNSGGFRPDGGPGLQFDNPLDLTSAPSAYLPASVTNLFVVNNLLHDVHQRYGFTEAAGNFQQLNYGGQGAGNDAVRADAQDGSGTNNANFGTPPDGSAPRMQQFIWTNANPDRASDLDNGVIIHEYGHGVSNRLTGGPANSSALNATQSGGMGEGWSDWWALMFTQKPTDAQNGAYGIGTYLINQPPTGTGIRVRPYSFDMAVNPLTWDNFGTSGSANGINKSTAVHFAGTIWSSALWDLNWLLINKYGFDPDLSTGYAPGGGPASAGNKLALRLVMDGLKLQPANPSFTQARDAIVQADLVLTGGVNRREIWAAFARRGLGFSASTAGSSATSVTTAFDLPPAFANPGVTGQTPAGLTAAQPASLTLTFSEDMDQTSFDPAADLAGFTGPGGANLLPAVTGFTWVNARTLRVNFTPQAAEGQYTLVLAPTVLSADGSPLEQDGDGTAGEAADDRYAAHFRYDSAALAVSATTPANGALAAAAPASIDVTFNEPVAAASVGADDLQLSHGTVTGATLLNPTTVRYTLAGALPPEAFVSFNLKYGAVTDAAGFPVRFHAGRFFLEGGPAAYPTPLAQGGPAGSLVYQGAAAGEVTLAGDADPYTLALDAGTRLAVFVDATVATLRPTVEVRDAANTLVASATAAANGQDALVAGVNVPAAGTYTVTVLGAANTAGTYDLRLTLDAALETERFVGTANNTPATAQSLDAAFLSPFGTGGPRVATVVGRSDTVSVPETEANGTTGTANSAVNTFFAEPTGTLYQLALSGSVNANGDGDWFNVGAMQAGDVLTVSLSAAGSSRGGLTDAFVELRNSAGTVVASDDDSGPGSDSLVYRFPVTAAGTYFLRPRAFGTEVGTYQLSAWLENAGAAPATGGPLTAEVEPNNTQAEATDASASWRQAQFQSNVAGSIGSGDQDFFAHTFAAGDRVTVFVDSTSALDARVSLLNSAGTVIALENGGSAGPGNDSPIYGFLIPSAGTYFVQVTAAAGTGSYVAQVYLSGATPPPGPGRAFDHYAVTLAAGESVTAALDRLAPGGTGLSLLDPSGAVVATAAAGPTNVDARVENFTAPAAGVYTLRVDDFVATDYALTVVRGGTFDAEANDSFAAAQPVGPGRAALGAVAAGNDDWYSLPVSAAGTVLVLSTATPGDGPGQFVNVLDPRVEVYDPAGTLVASDDNSAADGRNALLTYTFALTGDYRVRVAGAGGTAGEYALRAVDPPPAVTGVVVNAGADQRSMVTEIRVTFTEAVFAVNAPADAFTLTRTGPGGPTTVVPAVALAGNVATLTFPALLSGSLDDGLYELRVNAGQLRDASGNLIGTSAPTAFHRLYGDGDGDRDVDSNDFLQFLAVYDAVSPVFDFDGSGFVDSNDFLQFLARYDTTI